MSTVWLSWSFRQTDLRDDSVPPSVDAARQIARNRARIHLDAADHESRDMLSDRLRELAQFFQSAKSNTPAFAKDALSFASKWRLVADYVPFSNGGRHQRFLRAKFGEHIFSAEQLEAAVRQTIKTYLDDIREIENKMLLDLRADLADLPVGTLPSGLNSTQIEAALRDALERAGNRVSTDTSADAGSGVVSIIAGEVLARVAARAGLSAGILSTGAASSWTSFGVSLIGAIVVDQLLGAIWDWLADPKGALAADMNRKLDELQRHFIEGDDQNPGLRRKLDEYSRERASLRRQAILEVIGQMEGGPK